MIFFICIEPIHRMTSNMSLLVLVMNFNAIAFKISLGRGLGIIPCDFFFYFPFIGTFSPWICCWSIYSLVLSLPIFSCRLLEFLSIASLTRFLWLGSQQSPPTPARDIHSHILKDHNFYKKGRGKTSWMICRQCWDSVWAERRHPPIVSQGETQPQMVLLEYPSLSKRPFLVQILEGLCCHQQSCARGNLDTKS